MRLIFSIINQIVISLKKAIQIPRLQMSPKFAGYLSDDLACLLSFHSLLEYIVQQVKHYVAGPTRVKESSDAISAIMHTEGSGQHHALSSDS